MRYHTAFKFAALLLCALALLVSVACTTGVVEIFSLGLYSHSVQELQDQMMRDDLTLLAEDVAMRYAAANLTNCTKELIGQYSESYYPMPRPQDGRWFYSITDESGKVLESTYRGGEAREYEFLISPDYPVVVEYAQTEPGIVLDPLPPEYTLPTGEETAPTVPGQDEDFVYTLPFSWHDPETRLTHEYTLAIYRGPVYLVTLYLLPGAYETEVSYDWELMEVAHSIRYALFIPLALGLLTLGICATYLCSVAGKAPGRDGVRPGGMNQLPLDLYLALAVGCTVFLVILYINLIDLHFSAATAPMIALTICLSGWVGCLVIVGFVFAMAAQLRLRGGYWWRHTLICMTLRFLRRVLRNTLRILKGAGSRLKHGLKQFMALLPLTWQWLLWIAGLCLVVILATLSGEFWLILLALVITFAITLYVVHAFGTLLDSARRMSQGDLNIKVDDEQLIGGFAEFATHLNALAGVAVLSAKRQMRSERMKAELITNVSHDIKTPLTSIINYVDLLRNAQGREESDQYLEVLSRQSQRLKKLIDDLMELSKASTGNMAVEISRADAAEAINQALGEFSEKLEAAQLTPVFESPKDPVMMRCDGRLAWRVLSNLLSNAVKYALPGTRLYVDLHVLEDKVLISLKNISREPLNVSSEELMERFVRGDASRNTEGSGLGLNIAKSLMELQGGQLQLLVDGDLFKATLIFPKG